MSDLLHQVISGYHLAVRTLRREVLDAKPNQWRLAADTVARLYLPPKDLIVESFDWHGLPTECVRRAHIEKTAKPIVWIHGGGFAFCSPRTHRAAAAALSKATNRPVWLPDYPLAPEHPYPMAINAFGQIPIDGPLDIIGDSAGGNLALSWALRRQTKDRLVLLSPWLDLRVDAFSAKLNAKSHSAFDREDLREYASLYLAGHPATSSDCSPLLSEDAQIQGLDDVYLESSSAELLHSDSHAFAERCKTAGVPVTHRIESEAHHGWQLFPDLLPEAKRSIQKITSHLNETAAESA